MNRHLLFSVLFLLTGFFSTAQYTVQSKYFVYLQTEPAQPFYVKISGQTISANASGYLILPQLKNGDYKLTVGFPENKAPEQVFDFKIDAKDKGYLIKDFGADGWGLFDLQTMVVQKPLTGDAKIEKAVVKKEAPKPVVTPEPERKPEKQPEPTVTAVAPAPEKQELPQEPAVVAVTPEPDSNDLPPESTETAISPEPEKPAEPVADGISDFTRVLSKAANDPSLLEKKPEPPPQPQPQQRPTVTGSAEQTVPTGAVTADPSVPNQTASADGVTLVYDDRNETGQVDPITIFIPRPHTVNQNSGSEAGTKQEPEPETVLQPEETPAVSPESVASDKETESGFKVEEKPAIAQATPAEDTGKIASASSGCKAVADEDDFLKLRRTMAMQSNDDEMIAEAVKAFKQKCYTTAQVKYLSSMFLSNAGKYNLYEAAATHIADPEHFASLAGEIKDEFYKDKFSKLIR